MEYIISAVFKVESEGYQALTELKTRPVSNGYAVSQAMLVKKAGDKFTLLDAFDTGAETANDTALGGLVGSLFGILGGPIGVLLTGSMGALMGSAIDTGDAVHNASMLEKVTEQFVDGEVALVALAQEDQEGALNEKLDKFDVSLIRQDAAEVAEEVRRAEELQRELEREARKRLRAEKKAEREQAVTQWREKLSADFEALKKKVTKIEE